MLHSNMTWLDYHYFIHPFVKTPKPFGDSGDCRQNHPQLWLAALYPIGFCLNLKLLMR